MLRASAGARVPSAACSWCRGKEAQGSGGTHQSHTKRISGAFFFCFLGRRKSKCFQLYFLPFLVYVTFLSKQNKTGFLVFSAWCSVKNTRPGQVSDMEVGDPSCGRGVEA